MKRWWRAPTRLVTLFAAITAATALADVAVDVEKQRITVALTQDPPNLNAMMITDGVSNFIVGHVMEGLTRYDRRGRPVPGVAASWTIGEERMVFTLRDDARWSDGSAVTAADFVFAWRWVNDPANAAPFAAIMHPIANAEAIQRGELAVTELGVTALSAKVLEVRLERPCGYCLSLMSHPTFLPVKQSVFEKHGKRYGAEVDELLYNGPFELTKWIHNSEMLLEKSPHYWQRDKVNLQQIRIGYITEDNRARLNLFRDGSIAYVRLGADTVQDAARQRLRVRTFASGGVAYLWFNHRPERPTRDAALRQAIQSVFDSEDYVNRVIGIPGYRAANSLFPGWLQGVERSFVEEHPPMVPNRRTMTLDEPPELTLLTVTSPTGQKVAEYLQGLLREQLGITVSVDQQSFKQYLEKARRGDFDIVLSSWYPDFNDIVTYADLLVSWNPNNRGRYINDDYDRLFRTLQGARDATTRMAAAAELQQIIVTDVPVLPMAETGSAYLQHPQLRGVVRRVIGQDPDFTFARVSAPR